MNTVLNMIVLTPAVAGIAARILVNRRMRNEALTDSTVNLELPQIFGYPKGPVEIIFAFAVIVPIIIFLLPDSIVADARTLFNIFAIVTAILLFFSWAYLFYFKIIVNSSHIIYGAFSKRYVDLSLVTTIKYHWVNNGISLRLYAGNKQMAVFEGGISNFDVFAKCVKLRLSKNVHIETSGKASFGTFN